VNVAVNVVCINVPLSSLGAYEKLGGQIHKGSLMY